MRSAYLALAIDTFLEAVWGYPPLGPLGEIRSIRDGKVEQFFGIIDRLGIQGFINHIGRMNGDGWDTYFGVLPRTRAEGTADAVVSKTQVLWADVDAKQFSTDLETGKLRALGSLNLFSPGPQVIVDSGGGYHAYWFLDRPHAYEDARPVMAWIADVVGGDKVQDAPRVLRVPGTFNWKRQPLRAARELRSLTPESRRYRLMDLIGQMPIPRSPRRRALGDIEWAPLPDWLEELISKGAPKGQRSELAFKVVLWLLRYGRSPDEIRTIFEMTPDGIGAKYVEKGRNGDSWLDYTVRAAAQAVDARQAVDA